MSNTELGTEELSKECLISDIVSTLETIESTKFLEFLLKMIWSFKRKWGI